MPLLAVSLKIIICFRNSLASYDSVNCRPKSPYWCHLNSMAVLLGKTLGQLWWISIPSFYSIMDCTSWLVGSQIQILAPVCSARGAAQSKSLWEFLAQRSRIWSGKSLAAIPSFCYLEIVDLAMACSIRCELDMGSFLWSAWACVMAWTASWYLPQTTFRGSLWVGYFSLCNALCQVHPLFALPTFILFLSDCYLYWKMAVDLWIVAVVPFKAMIRIRSWSCYQSWCQGWPWQKSSRLTLPLS